MTDRELMQAVLEAMESLHRTGDTQVFDMYAAPVLIPALRERLAQPEQEPVCAHDIPKIKCSFCHVEYKQPEREPVAWMQEMPTRGDEKRSVRLTTVEALAREEWANPIPLYTTPPRREWQGLAADSTIQTVPAQGGLLPTMKEGKDFKISKPWVGLTDAELAEFSEAELGAYDLCLEVEAKLKEKNNAN